MGSLHVIQSLSHILNDDRVSFPALHQQEFQFPVSHFRQSRMCINQQTFPRRIPLPNFPVVGGYSHLSSGTFFMSQIYYGYSSQSFLRGIYIFRLRQNSLAFNRTRWLPDAATSLLSHMEALNVWDEFIFFGRDWSFCRVREIRAIHRQQHTRFRNPAMVHYGPDW